MPVCTVENCESEVVGLDDGWDAHGREGVACTDCLAFQRRHNHWPDEEPEISICVECRIDEGAVRHECPESPADAVILDPGDQCFACHAIIDDHGNPVEGSA